MANTTWTFRKLAKLSLSQRHEYLAKSNFEVDMAETKEWDNMPTFLENRSVRRRALKAAHEDLKPLIRNRAEQILQELRKSQVEARAVRQAILAANKKKAAETIVEVPPL